MVFRNVCLAVLVPLFAANPGGEAAKGVAELQGVWKLVGVEADRETVGIADARPTLMIKGDQLIYGGEAIARIGGDSTTKPKLLDLHFANPERVYEGVFVVDNDKLKICVNGQGEGVRERPQSFIVKDHPTWRLLLLERAKADDPKAGTGFIGVQMGYNDDRTEIVVAAALEGSPAKKAGLKKDDVLLQVAGNRVTDLRSAVDAVRRTAPRTDLTLRIRRDGKEMDISLKVGVVPFHFVAGLQ